MRTIIEIPDRDIRRLARTCRAEGISRAEAIRRAVSLFLAKRSRDPESDGFGLWREREEDGLAYQDRLRDEW